MITLLLQPLALSVLLHVASHRLTHGDGDDSYDVKKDNFIELLNLDLNLDIDLDLDLPVDIDDGAEGLPLLIEETDA
jgi:hypothetical protein